jgi:putative cardiolipin synthase
MGLHDHFNFRDIDVMGVGPVARQTSNVFDLFWNSGWVIHPDQTTRDKADAAAPSQRAAMQKELRRSEELERFSLTPQNWESEFSALSATLHLGSSEVLSDRPGPDGISNDLYEWITNTIPQVKAELLVTNAYLIPDTRGVNMLTDLNEKGVNIKIHTNSLASQDVPAVNSHYKTWRSPLLQAGAGLYEARTDAEIKVSVVDTPPISATYMGLHSKSMVVDRRFAVIGSANLDPRSAFLNSEMIAVIDSEGLAEELAKAILRDMAPSNSWEVRLDDDGKLQWQNDVETTRRQPARDSFQPIADWFFMLFPKRFY